MTVLLNEEQDDTNTTTSSTPTGTVSSTAAPQRTRFHCRDAFYIGPCNENGEKHGVGELHWKDRAVYKGHIERNMAHGHGEMVWWSNGSQSQSQQQQQQPNRYKGEWQNVQYHGSGCRFYSDGTIYKGEFHQGVRQGQGSVRYINGDYFEGDWYGNLMHGKGKYYYVHSCRFEGSFANSKRSGKGETYYPSGRLEIGLYANGDAYGDGVMWSRNRSQAWRIVSAASNPRPRRRKFSPLQILNPLAHHLVHFGNARTMHPIRVKKAKRLETEIELAASRSQMMIVPWSAS